MTEDFPTLMMIISRDWKSVGLTAGSKTVDAVWKLCRMVDHQSASMFALSRTVNKPAISRDRAKLLRKRIWNASEKSGT